MAGERRRLWVLIAAAGVLAVVFVVLHLVPWSGGAETDEALLDAADWEGTAVAGTDDPPENPGPDPERTNAGRRPSSVLPTARSSPPPPPAYHALARIARRPEPKHVPQLRRAARSPDKKVRVAVATAMGRLGEEADTDVLREMLRNGKDGEVRATAAMSLGRLKCWDAGPELIEALSDKDTRVRARAGAALRRIMGVDFRFRATDPQRDRVIRRIREWWPKFYEGHLQSRSRKE